MENAAQEVEKTMQTARRQSMGRGKDVTPTLSENKNTNATVGKSLNNRNYHSESEVVKTT